MNALVPIEYAAECDGVSVDTLRNLFYSKQNFFRVHRVNGRFLVDPDWKNGGALGRDIEQLYWKALECAGTEWKLAVALARYDNEDRHIAVERNYRYMKRFRFKHFEKAMRFRTHLKRFLQDNHLFERGGV